VQLQEQISEIMKLDAEVIAISTSGNQKDVEKSKRVLEITYILIPMPEGKIVEEFGLKYDSFGAAYATILLDKKGQVRFKRVEQYATRTSASTIIKELQGIQ
jgi:peroxiredoxin